MTVVKLDVGDVLHGSDMEIVEFAEALGITKPCYRIVIDMSADSVAVAYVEMYVSRKAIELLTNGPRRPAVRIVDDTKRTQPKAKAALGQRILLKK